MDHNSEDADGTDFCIRVIIGCNVKEVLADKTSYYDGAEMKVDPILAKIMKILKKAESASTFFTTGGASAYEHVSRQHVRDIMTAYGPHLKPNASTNFTFGDEFHRILNNVAMTMKSWK